MKSGYGRGYYGEGQLAQEPRRKKSWFTVVVVLGVGAAAVWWLWPRNKALPDFSPMPDRPLPPGTNELPMQLAQPSASQFVQPAPAQLGQPASAQLGQPASAQLGQPASAQLGQPASAQLALAAPTSSSPPTGAFLKQLEDDARARHFLTVKDYEDSVIKDAKRLQAAGAKVMLAPHLQHLSSRLEP
jgi:hypothetical protein